MMTQGQEGELVLFGEKAECSIPLVIDLDGTLIKGDLLLEGFAQLLRHNPFNIVYVLFWLLRGRAYLKQQIARRVEIDPASLPYQEALLAYARQEAGRGRPVYLATASDERAARAVADHVGCFTQVLASDGQQNLSGNRKLRAIQETVQGGDFDYAGNARVDLPIWRQARFALVVNPAPGLERLARRQARVTSVFEDRRQGVLFYLKAVRLHQWLKNLLLGVPLLTSHSWLQPADAISVVCAFFAFGLSASATYLFNDMLDIPSDRQHPRKRSRPLASGDLSLRAGVILLAVLLTGGLALATAVSTAFLLVLLWYIATTLSYSLFLKRFILVDIILLAGLYTLRIVAGTVAIGVTMSSWLLAFSMFFFLSLALVKRTAELKVMEQEQRASASGRDYQVTDYPILCVLGVASGCLAVLVLVLFVDSSHTLTSYSHPDRLWLLAPFMFYWIGRLWIKTARGEMHDDPLVFSLQDRTSWLAVAAMLLVTLLAV